MLGLLPREELEGNSLQDSSAGCWGQVSKAGLAALELKSALVTHSHCWHPGCASNTTNPKAINQCIFKFLFCLSILMSIRSPEIKKSKCKSLFTVLNWQLHSSWSIMTELSFWRTRGSIAEKVPDCTDKKYFFKYTSFYMSSLSNRNTSQLHSTNNSFDTDTVKCINYFPKCFKH